MSRRVQQIKILLSELSDDEYGSLLADLENGAEQEPGTDPESAGEKTFTVEQIKKMSHEDRIRYSKDIIAAMDEGRIKE